MCDDCEAVHEIFDTQISTLRECIETLTRIVEKQHQALAAHQLELTQLNMRIRQVEIHAHLK